MITRIHLKNFKCFENTAIPLSPLTLLTGFNAGGKSSAFQGLLLLAQSFRSGRQTPNLSLNGPLARLGTPGEVIYNKADKNEIVIDIEEKDLRIEFIVHEDGRDHADTLRIRRIKAFHEGDIVEKIAPEIDDRFYISRMNHPAVIQLINDLSDLVYISAVRGATTDVFPSPEDPFPVYADVGVQGEFAPWWFYRQIDEAVDPSRCHFSEQAKTLRRQFNAWAGELFPGAQGHVQRVEKTSLLRLELRISEFEDWRRPANIGYGLTYAFALLVSGLLARPGQLIIIDSPEAHLHPLGQSRIGCFLAQVAASGVQVIVETHSDHVLNGMRLAVKNQVISHKDVSIHFFTCPAPQCQNGEARVISPMVDQSGNLSDWPEGFFDQSEKDLSHLAGWE